MPVNNEFNQFLKVNSEAKYCRCCGHETELVGSERYCMTGGCQPLGHQSREFCEHDGAKTRADGTCTYCTRPPVGPR